VHKNNRLSPQRFLRLLCSGAALAALLATTGCANFYVDPGLKDVPPEQMKTVANPQPVQLLFEFQTKGASNPRATEHLKKQVAELTVNSKLFSQVSDAPVANGAILNIVINNVPLTDNAAAKGFATGLTFGLAGNTVTDGYICTVDYLPGNGSPKISKTVRHAIHTTIGAKSAPVNVEKAPSLEAAVTTMVRQIVSNALKDVADDAAFK
jgi:hypothetical protein